MSKLYVFGDSYSTPEFCVAPADSWWGLLAKDLGKKISAVENYSWPGNNIDSIGHVLMTLSGQFNKDDYIAIGIPPLQRLTMFNPAESNMQQSVLYDSTLAEQDRKDVLCHTGLAQYPIHDMDKKFISLWNPSWIEAQTLRHMLTMDSFLKSRVNNVVWLNASVPFQPLTQWPVLETLQQLAQSHDNFLLFDKTYYTVNYERNRPADFDTHGWFGHHSAVGNKAWYTEAVRPLIAKLGWL